MKLILFKGDVSLAVVTCSSQCAELSRGEQVMQASLVHGLSRIHVLKQVGMVI